jgi:hypothetical protein
MSQINHGNNAIRICVDSTQGGHLSGRIYSLHISEPLPFSDAGNLVLIIEDILDAQNFPQAFQRARMFVAREPAACPVDGGPEECLAAGVVSSAFGNMATFELAVLSRQCSTWQGVIDWLDGNPPTSFSSDLEFLRLVDERLS